MMSSRLGVLSLPRAQGTKRGRAWLLGGRAVVKNASVAVALVTTRPGARPVSRPASSAAVQSGAQGYAPFVTDFPVSAELPGAQGYAPFVTDFPVSGKSK